MLQSAGTRDSDREFAMSVHFKQRDITDAGFERAVIIDNKRFRRRIPQIPEGRPRQLNDKIFVRFVLSVINDRKRKFDTAGSRPEL